MNDNISDKDKKDWHKFINSTEKLPNKDSTKKKQNIIKTKSIDLHGYSLEEANVEIKKFIKKAVPLTIATGVIFLIAIFFFQWDVQVSAHYCL